ncbi:MAG: asparagine synthase C-terminal domain-containing protein [Phycisphaerales bacterium]|nr:asparagine synthase C-terminal domain-containing protein [Phycisphaerales bacterium]
MLRLDSRDLAMVHQDLGVPSRPTPAEQSDRFSEVRRVVRQSVQAHLRADVPTCCLLSGGLDSAIVTTIASQQHATLRTYCAGATSSEGDARTDDFAFARGLASRLGTQHAEATIDEAMFGERWREMVARQGVPLSTPNEVAINEVARRLRADGNVVTLSGEGADELFGGYDQSMCPAAEHVAAGNRDPWLFQLGVGSWCPVELKPRVLNSTAWAAAGHDEWVRDHFRTEYMALARGDDPASELADHLRFQRRVNLAGLLLRLDSATMLESVEGRTPFADGWVAALAESLPIEDRFIPPDRTKIALREAFSGLLPPEILARPKASFPLPFASWMRRIGPTILASDWLRTLFRPEALELISARPEEHWRLAWPAANLAIWSASWWPSSLPTRSPTTAALP